jgi:predicted lipase
METKLPKEVVLKAVKNCVDVYAHEDDFTVDKTIPGYCILTVEGTSSMDDWVTNLKFLIRSDDTHRGFKENAMRTLTSMVLNYESLCRERVLVLAGHSLGGATATVLADLLLPNTPELHIITIGSPRPGGRGLRERLKDVDHLRFVHGSDIVPKSPPYLTGYVHTHPQVYLEDANETRFDRVADHNAADYYTAVEKLLNE